MALDTMLNPVFAVYQDYTRYNQQYYEIKIDHVFEKSGEDAFYLRLFSEFGFVSNGSELYQANGLVQITSGVSTQIELGNLRLVPKLAYTSAADERSRNAFWAGIALQYGR